MNDTSMKIAIMQPYFFPYSGYFSLIKNTDKFIIFDVVQFIRHGWIERNRTLKPDNGWQYISVPLEKHSRNTVIKDIKIKNNDNWKKKIISQLGHYKRKAPYFYKTINLIKECFEYETCSITLLNTYFLKKTSEYLGIDFSYEIYSDMDINIESPKSAGDWALNIMKAIGAKHYINPYSGVEIFDEKKFKENNVRIDFLKVELSEYNQKNFLFEPGLSIIDVMMFNSPDAICQMLDNYKFI